jgi:hypothetical protein
LLVYLAYVDESGQAGRGGRYTLAVVLLRASDWPGIQAQVIGFRKFLRTRFGIRVSDELKADYLLRDGGPLRPLELSESARFAVYRQHMRLQPKIGLRTFAVVVRQPQATQQGVTNPRDVAWQLLLKELERFTVKNKTEAVLVHEQQGASMMRHFARRAYRQLSGTTTNRPATLLLDGVVSPEAKASTLFQLADLNAHAAYRAVYPPPASYRFPVVVPQTWNELGDARLTPLSQPSTGPRGILLWP